MVETLRLKKLVSYLYHIKDTVIIACSPRSGSTWLGEKMVDIGKFDWVNEPLRLRGGGNDPLYSKGIRPRTCLIDADEARIASVSSVMNEVLTGKIGYLRLYPRLRRRLLLKFVRINRMLPWVVREFRTKYNILMLRHPCAVIASQLAMHHGGSIWSNVTNPAPDIPEYLSDSVAPLINGRIHRALSINWALDQKIPLYDDKPSNTLLVFYEDLIVNPAKEIERICNFCGINFNFLPDRPSSTAASDFSRDKQILKWKEQLSPEVIDDILSTCHKLGVDVYGSDVMPIKRPW